MCPRERASAPLRPSLLYHRGLTIPFSYEGMLRRGTSETHLDTFSSESCDGASASCYRPVCCPALARRSALAVTSHIRRMSARWPPSSFRIKLPLSPRWLVVETHACYRAPNPALRVAASPYRNSSRPIDDGNSWPWHASHAPTETCDVFFRPPPSLSIVAMLYSAT
jgi:hypothetical protein